MNIDGLLHDAGNTSTYPVNSILLIQYSLCAFCNVPLNNISVFLLKAYTNLLISSHDILLTYTQVVTATISTEEQYSAILVIKGFPTEFRTFVHNYIS